MNPNPPSRTQRCRVRIAGKKAPGCGREFAPDNFLIELLGNLFNNGVTL